jgi:hypothetical protein
MAYNSYNLIGQRFGNLIVVSRLGNGGKNKCQRWLCNCECGNSVEKVTTELTNKRNKILCCNRKCKLHSGKHSILFKGYEDISGWLWCHIKTGARERDLEFSITIEYAWDLFIMQNRKCALSGIEICFSKSQEDRSNGTASLDRIDSTKGYVINNCQWVHKDINFMKQDLTEDEFIGWCQLVTLHQRIK